MSKATEDNSPAPFSIFMQKAAAASFMPIAGLFVKQPFVVAQHFQAAYPELNTIAALKATYNRFGILGFYRGSMCHLSKILPSNIAAVTAVDQIEEYRLKHQEIVSSHSSYLPFKIVAAGTTEAMVGAFQESNEFFRNITKGNPAATIDLMTRIWHGLRILPATTIRNIGGWGGILTGKETAQRVDDAYHNPVLTTATKVGFSIFTAIATTPFHVAAAQAWKHGGCDINPFVSIWRLATEGGVKRVFSCVVPRTGMVGVSVGLNMLAMEYLQRVEESTAHPPQQPQPDSKSWQEKVLQPSENNPGRSK